MVAGQILVDIALETGEEIRSHQRQRKENE